MSAGLMDNDEKLELARLRMLKDPVLAVITAPVDCPTAKQVRELRAAAGFVGWSARQVRATGTLHPMHRSLTEDRMHGGASTNAEAEASGDLIAERDFLANIVRSHETQILRMTDERAELLAKIEQIERLSRTADRATIDVASMLGDIARAAIASVGGAA